MMSVLQLLLLVRPHASTARILIGFIALFIQSGATAISDTSKESDYYATETKILNVLLANNYDRKVRPIGVDGAGPTEANMSMNVRLTKIHFNKMEYSMHLRFQLQWFDDRLRFDIQKEFSKRNDRKLRYLTLTNSDRIWMPELFFSNEKQAHLHSSFIPSAYIRIHPDGEVLYSTRISLTLSCPMSFTRFPFDKQTCYFRISSYGWTTNDLIFKWKRPDPVQVTSDLHLQGFILKQFTTDKCDSHGSAGIFSCLQVEFLFRRVYSYYIIQIYFPCCILVMASWVSFWMNDNDITERVSLVITALLTMVSIMTGIIYTLPHVDSLKALDMWTSGCLSFLFGALLESAVVTYFLRSEEMSKNCELELTVVTAHLQKLSVVRAEGRLPDAAANIQRISSAIANLLGARDNIANPQGTVKPTAHIRDVATAIVNLLEAADVITNFQSAPDATAHLQKTTDAIANLLKAADAISNLLRDFEATGNMQKTSAVPTDRFKNNCTVLQMETMAMYPGAPIALDKATQYESQAEIEKKYQCCATNWLSQFPTRSKRIDMVSRIVFPLSFAIFNFGYWYTYLIHNE